MAKKTKRSKPERTSARVAQNAGRLLNGSDTAHAERWLRSIARDRRLLDSARALCASLTGGPEGSQKRGRLCADAALTE